MLHCWAGLSTPGRSEVPGLAALAVGIALSKTKCIVVGGWKQGRMVIGLRFFHTLGTVGLFQDCEQGEGRILGPGEDFVSSAAQCCPSLLQKGRSPLQLSSGVSPGAALPHTPRVLGLTSRCSSGLAADGAERMAGRSRPQPEVPASSARSPCLQHSLTPRTSRASPGRSPQWSVR